MHTSSLRALRTLPSQPSSAIDPCHDFLVILAMSTTCAHGTGVAIPLYSSHHTAITFEPLCSHIKPEGLTSSPLRGPTQWLVCNGTQWFRLYTTSPLRGSTRLLDAHPCPRAHGFGRGTMPLVALWEEQLSAIMHVCYK